ncbi:MAG: GDP-mannose-dependent alpha-(1-6)-phosphatidylinositol monomannoside mannosyltransferase [candidate division WS6 bacterium OLB20]|uniref:GDP-mannose-dependent alpha-(1-6)-phosphatidylinositol monomannoside mannosyltransferase n=1 Tax=candidate division WS6 bacterium OLB20 TaxID=1617426 RepID=A0A136LYS2_9BACT|nr:MAG: GDP-mannose-dependent alpha-(1-6)-phosphatidylinositol monomannoside mannosyltransferase [candidate division WS6 bacterium OLB20]
MNILLLNRYDPAHPRAGGAERFSLENMKRFVADGHSVTWFASSFRDSVSEETVDGVRIMRRGNRLSVIMHAWRHFRKEDGYDLVIDEMHALPFMTPLYVPAEKRVLLIHEVAGVIWSYMTPLPVALIGRVVERLLLRLFYRTQPVLTVSKAGRDELVSCGIPSDMITVIPEGVSVSMVEADKTERPSIVYFGGLRPLKRVEHQLVAVSLLKKEYPYLKMYILGNDSSAYARKLKKIVSQLKLDDRVEFTGFVPQDERDRIVASAWVTFGTSVKEGWGLAVAEAAALGTPAIVYPTPGNTEAVEHMETGLHTIAESPDKLAQAARKLFSEDDFRQELSASARKAANALTWEKSYHAFKDAVLSDGKA